MPAASSISKPNCACSREGWTCKERGRSAASTLSMKGSSPTSSIRGASAPSLATATDGFNGCVPIHISAIGSPAGVCPMNCGIATGEPHSYFCTPLRKRRTLAPPLLQLRSHVETHLGVHNDLLMRHQAIDLNRRIQAQPPLEQSQC